MFCYADLAAIHKSLKMIADRNMTAMPLTDILDNMPELQTDDDDDDDSDSEVMLTDGHAKRIRLEAKMTNESVDMFPPQCLYTKS